jgi:hypothetical protein
MLATTQPCLYTLSYDSADPATQVASMVITNSELDFGTLAPGAIAEQVLRVFNEGTGTLLLTDLTWPTNSIFSFEYPQAEPVDIPSKSFIEFPLVASATNELAARDTITFYSNDPSHPSKSVTLLANVTSHANQLPVISAQPQSRTNAAGTTAVLSVRASSSTRLSYRWYKNGAPLASGGNISGVFTPDLSIASAGLADAGVYMANVSDSLGSIPSGSAGSNGWSAFTTFTATNAARTRGRISRSFCCPSSTSSTGPR